MRKASASRWSTRVARSSPADSAWQKMQPGAGSAAPTYAIRHGAQRRFKPAATASRVDQFPQSLADLEERDPLLRHVDRAPRLGVAPLAGVAMPDPEAAEATKLDLVTFRERVGDVVEDRVDDGLGLLLRQIGEPRHFVDQIGFRHRPTPCWFAILRAGRAADILGHASTPPERMSTRTRV